MVDHCEPHKLSLSDLGAYLHLLASLPRCVVGNKRHLGCLDTGCANAPKHALGARPPKFVARALLLLWSLLEVTGGARDGDVHVSALEALLLGALKLPHKAQPQLHVAKLGKGEGGVEAGKLASLGRVVGRLDGQQRRHYAPPHLVVHCRHPHECPFRIEESGGEHADLGVADAGVHDIDCLEVCNVESWILVLVHLHRLERQGAHNASVNLSVLDGHDGWLKHGGPVELDLGGIVHEGQALLPHLEPHRLRDAPKDRGREHRLPLEVGERVYPAVPPDNDDAPKLVRVGARSLVVENDEGGGLMLRLCTGNNGCEAEDHVELAGSQTTDEERIEGVELGCSKVDRRLELLPHSLVEKG
mmetsp:Transcript_8254/g.19231  ORF Transcript_8254/g.19231 Transcript_8254/m.19231 type:complete len:359 (-) Transcript_8254:138-1214(-)